jgi:DNA-binding MarR family transcriptional regulator
LTFNNLKQLCALTDGDLSRHLSVLEEDGMIKIVKSQDRNRPQTVCRITASGAKRYLEYLAALEQVVRDTAKVTKEQPATSLGRSLLPLRAWIFLFAISLCSAK